MKFNSLLLLCILSCLCCDSMPTSKNTIIPTKKTAYLTVLGTAQDGGFPHIGCQKECCLNFYNGTYKKQRVVSLGLVDQQNNQKWIFEATPDISTQLADLEQNHLKKETLIDGVFLTHAHIGHYTGLMYFGREALGKQGIKVYAMPKMKEFIETNGPWSQLVSIKNIELLALQDETSLKLNNQLTVTPFLIPHRDEFSETVGYRITGPEKTALFIPDIDKWHTWDKNIIEEVKKVDYAFLDATFFNQKEVKRAMTEVPHPFVEETMKLFKNESKATKNKVIFIHFNHTNPALQAQSSVKKEAELLGFNFAAEGQNYAL